MFNSLKRLIEKVDWVLLAAVIPIAAAGLVTMHSLVPGVVSDPGDVFFARQSIWILISLLVFFLVSFVDMRFMRRQSFVVGAFLAIIFFLLLLFGLGAVFQGAQSWFDLGAFAIQPSDPAKLVVILLLAKYFSRRNMEIKNPRHIIVSGVYVFLIFLFVLLQPDFGSAMIIFCIWLGMVLIAGISFKHLAIIALIGATVFTGLWNFGFAEYQKDRIRSFLNPLADVSGTGYNAYQSTIAVGSGQVLGKGVGYGTQSRLKFLPEYETDFVFAAFAEEWGLIGVLLLFALFVIIFWRIVRIARLGETNFEILFAAGVGVYLAAHFFIHVGMNIGLLPITGTTIPFMSYGGSHLVTEFLALGILVALPRRNHPYGIA